MKILKIQIWREGKVSLGDMKGCHDVWGTFLHWSQGMAVCITLHSYFSFFFLNNFFFFFFLHNFTIFSSKYIPWKKFVGT